ncbi:hypothetical protein HPB50_010688 [Hyalomma asiaticum]|uniref:Uncharacterized protein n=1 Tax=Hyalomma asiaticum TaxID=266040 RepID=A0ACB7SFR5_HYAAI|nr:hypothetical protein HPB50_010688 [Hyalomma asiaticum]
MWEGGRSRSDSRGRCAPPALRWPSRGPESWSRAPVSLPGCSTSERRSAHWPRGGVRALGGECRVCTSGYDAAWSCGRWWRENGAGRPKRLAGINLLARGGRGGGGGDARRMRAETARAT